MMDNVLTIISILLTLAAVCVSYYLYIKKVIERKSLDAINNAENTDKEGKEKLADAVEEVYSVLPVVVKPFISRAVVETIIQTIFDKVEEYAQKQVNKEKEEINE